MPKIKIKPLTSNRCWQGRRFKSPMYKDYEKELFYILPKLIVPSGKLKLTLQVGYSNKLCDIDNFVKPFVDVLQKKYNFNDRNIYRLIVDKVDVEKGKEYIDFEIETC